MNIEFTDIRKKGKKVLVDMSRRSRMYFSNDYGLEAFKMQASRHWVEGVVIDRQTKPNMFVVAVNQTLTDEAKYCSDIELLLWKYKKDVDYKEIFFSRGRRNSNLLKIGTDINYYFSHIEDEKIKDAIEQDRGILFLLRKDIEEWTNEDLHSFYYFFMVPHFSFNNDYEWINFDEVGSKAADIVIHARFLYGIREFPSGWNETTEKKIERYMLWNDQQKECDVMEKELYDGYLNCVDVKELREKFEKYCLICDANRGVSFDLIIRRRKDLVFKIKHEFAWHVEDPNQEEAIYKFYLDIAVNPDDAAKSKFVIFKKSWA